MKPLVLFHRIDHIQLPTGQEAETQQPLQSSSTLHLILKTILHARETTKQSVCPDLQLELFPLSVEDLQDVLQELPGGCGLLVVPPQTLNQFFGGFWADLFGK